MVLMGPDGEMDFSSSPSVNQASAITSSGPAVTNSPAHLPARGSVGGAWHTPPQKEVNETGNLDVHNIRADETGLSNVQAN